MTATTIPTVLHLPRDMTIEALSRILRGYTPRLVSIARRGEIETRLILVREPRQDVQQQNGDDGAAPCFERE